MAARLSVVPLDNVESTPPLRISPSPVSCAGRSPASIQSQPQDPSSSERVQLPAYVGRTKTEIRERFQELEWRERERLLQIHQVSDLPLPWAQEQDPKVKIRNRYLNVQPWTNNRIHLRVPPPHCDYINASPILLKSSRMQQEKRYIATQGPKEGQLHHLWRMVWDETLEPAVIVMLTRTWEAGRDKCFPYFPESFEEDTLTIKDEEESGDGFEATIKLLEIEEDRASMSIVRKLLLVVGDDTKTVWHFHFAGWPDFSIPEDDDRLALLQLIRISDEKTLTPENPRIIHCSAGVGRSGTFIALDFLLQEIESDMDDNDSTNPDLDIVFDTVNSLREQRMLMVQSEAQLDFIYEVLKDKWLARRLGSHRDDRDVSEESHQALQGLESGSPAVDHLH